MSEGLSWEAIGVLIVLGIAVVGWVVSISTLVAVTSWRVKNIATNHLPHIKTTLDGLPCGKRGAQLANHDARIRSLEKSVPNP